MMLEEKEENRISSPILSLITQADNVLLSNITVPHEELFQVTLFH